MLDILQKKLEYSSGKKLKLKINDNHSTMLSVRWEPDHVRISIHRMFLRAPQHVLRALGSYLQRKDKTLSLAVREFIEENMRRYNYSHQVRPNKLITQGTVYNLQQIYDELNEIYFKKQLKLKITWFGRPVRRPRMHATLGLYQESLRLIKINRLLDSPAVPHYLISYVVYHEMVHHVCPSYYDERGIHQIHSKEFKRREKKFHHFALAQKWMKENQNRLFLSLD